MQRVRVSSQQVPVQKLGDSQMTLSPKFKLAASQSRLLDPLVETELSVRGDPLIPGLPDDIALTCLLKLPVSSHSAGKTVCKRWYQLFGNKERFYTRRKEMGFQDPWLFVFSFHKCKGKIQWHVLDLTHFSWHTIPQMPCIDKVCPHGFRCVSFPFDGSLFVCGGVVFDADCPLNAVMKFNVQKNSWSVMKKMITARSFFASGVINGNIYVAGGNSTDLFELNSAEVMDPKNGIWRPIANMLTNMASYDAAVLNGKLLVTEGWFWPFYVVPRGQIYDPITDNWENMADGLREGWTGSSVVIYGHLFVVTEHERTKLKVYDMNNDSWKTVGGPPLPEQICKPFSVSCCNSRIYVVGRNLHVAVGCILRLNETQKNPSFLVRWEVVEAPEAFSSLTPSSAQVLFGLYSAPQRRLSCASNFKNLGLLLTTKTCRADGVKHTLNILTLLLFHLHLLPFYTPSKNQICKLYVFSDTDLYSLGSFDLHICLLPIPIFRFCGPYDDHDGGGC